MEAEGYGAWWNQYGNISLATCVERAKKLDFIIIKALYPSAREAFKVAGIKWGTERYVYPTQPDQEAAYLIAEIAAGAKFVVINAEVEWEATDGVAMRRLIQLIQARYPNIELY